MTAADHIEAVRLGLRAHGRSQGRSIYRSGGVVALWGIRPRRVCQLTARTSYPALPGSRVHATTAVGPGCLRLRGDPGSVRSARLAGVTSVGTPPMGRVIPRAHRQNGGCSCEIKGRPQLGTAVPG